MGDETVRAGHRRDSRVWREKQCGEIVKENWMSKGEEERRQREMRVIDCRSGFLFQALPPTNGNLSGLLPSSQFQTATEFFVAICGAKIMTCSRLGLSPDAYPLPRIQPTMLLLVYVDIRRNVIHSLCYFDSRRR